MTTGAAAQVTDLVRVKGSASTLRGTVSKTTPDTITLVTSRGSEDIPVESIESLVLSDDPTGLRGVRESLESGQIEQAAQQLQGIEAPALGRKVLRQDVAFYKALASSRLALEGSGEITDAARQMVDFARGNPDSYHFYAACRTLGDLAMSLGKYDSAGRWYEKLSSARAAALRTRSSLLQARAKQLSGDGAAAVQLYQAAAAGSTAEGDHRSAMLASIGEAACRAETGDPDQGIQIIEKIIAENDPADTELFARAYTALGTCYRTTQQPVDALLAYLRVDTLFFTDHESHAEALYYLSDLWSRINKPDEALKARNLLKSQYAGTSWAQKL